MNRKWGGWPYLTLHDETRQPFEIGDDSHADVDMELLWKLEEYLNEKIPGEVG